MKTADEMFSELGYKKMPKCDGVYEAGIQHPSKRFVRIDISRNSVYKELVFPAGSTHTEPFTPSEILACAQFIKEMEENIG